MENREGTKSTIYCPNCNKEMYSLEGALNPIYVCSHCGNSIDEKQCYKKEESSNYEINEIGKPLLPDLFSGQFMKKYTAFNSFSEFIDNCDLFGQCMEEINKDIIAEIPERKINKYVKEHTRFDTWDQMFEKAVEWYLKM